MIFSRRMIYFGDTVPYYEGGSPKMMASIRYGSNKYKYLLAVTEDANKWYVVKGFSDVTYNHKLGVIYNKPMFYCMTKDYAKYTTNGKDWFDIGLPGTHTVATLYSGCKALYFANNKYTMLISPTEVYQSTDLQTWTATAYTFNNAAAADVSLSVYPKWGGGNYYYAIFRVSSKSTVYRSTNGLSWTQIGVNNMYSFSGISCDTKGFMMAWGYIAVSQTTKKFSNLYYKNYSTSYTSLSANIVHSSGPNNAGLVYMRIKQPDDSYIHYKASTSAMATQTALSTTGIYSGYANQLDLFYTGNTSSPKYSRDLVTETAFDFSEIVGSEPVGYTVIAAL